MTVSARTIIGIGRNASKIFFTSEGSKEAPQFLQCSLVCIDSSVAQCMYVCVCVCVCVCGTFIIMHHKLLKHRKVDEFILEQVYYIYILLYVIFQ